MKKLLMLVICCAMLAAVVGCGPDKPASGKGTPSPTGSGAGK